MNASSRFRSVSLTFLLALAFIPTLAQKVPVVAHEGSWVVEWTPKGRQCIVRFYNVRQQLIYEETLDRRLNIARRQTKQRLNVALDQALYVWNATHKLPTDHQWVAVQFEKK